MKHRNIIVLVTFIVLLFVLIFPTVYIQAECDNYKRDIEAVKTAIQNRDSVRAMELFENKIANWDQENTLVHAFMPHQETEFVKDAIIELQHSIQNKEYDLALERADILYSEIDHLIYGSHLSLENFF